MSHYDVQKAFAKAIKAEDLELKEHAVMGKYLGFCVETDGEDDFEYLSKVFPDYPLKKDKYKNRFRYYPDKPISELEMEELSDTFLF